MLYLFSGLLLCLYSSSILAVAPYSGGGTTVVLHRQIGKDAFSYPATNLSITRKDNFFVGNAFFRNAWVTAPSSTVARDGLGPLFNTNACQSCHVRDGRGSPPSGREPMISLLIRIGQPPDEPSSAMASRLPILPDLNYGTQIQNRAIPGVEPEAQVTIEWEEFTGTFADGSSYRLRKPHYHFEHLAYGELDENTRVSGRVALAMIGLGLLEAIPLEKLQQREDPLDKNQDGISGRLNQVWDIERQQTVEGRFGWKASQPTVRQQAAAAFSGDIGITSSIFPQQPCTSVQQKCLRATSGGKPEVSEQLLDLVVFYSKTLAVPARRSHNSPVVLKGEQLFKQIGCVGCHVETWHTGVDPDFPELSKQEIHPYTDLLLHDMGEGLADQLTEFAAVGSEWRTPPLWGIGLVETVNQHTNFLHDGRARTIEEAILWHDGEALLSRQQYITLNKADRRALLVFLQSL